MPSTDTRTTHPNLAGNPNSTAIKMLFDAYLNNDQLLIEEAMKMLTWLEDMQMLNRQRYTVADRYEGGERRER